MAAKKSTIDRFIRVSFQTLEKVSPALGARLVERLWFRLPTVPEKAKRLRIELPAAQSFEAQHDDGLIRGHAYGSGPVVYLVHGWGGWGLQLASFVPPLVEAGYKVVTYDAPSHGRSDPGREGPGSSSMPELAEALKAVIAVHGEPNAVIAHSLGAAAVVYGLLDGLTSGRLVFVATATDFQENLDGMQAHLGFGPRIRAGFERRFARRFAPMQEFSMPAVMSRLDGRELPELLIFHDRSDRETSSEGSAKLAATWPNAELVLTDDLGHHRILRDPAVLTGTVAFLAPATGRTATGRE